MKRLFSENIDQFVSTVVSEFGTICKVNKYREMSIVAKYDEAKHIIESLIKLGFSINSIELENVDIDYYDKEYIISLCNLDSDKEIWCQKMYINDSYLFDASYITYVLDNCSSKCLENIESENSFEVHIEDMYCEDECCDIQANSVKNDIKTTGKSSFTVNGKEVSREEFETFKKKVDEEYLDTVRDMLLKHCSIMDEINQMSRLLRW